MENPEKVASLTLDKTNQLQISNAHLTNSAHMNQRQYLPFLILFFPLDSATCIQGGTMNFAG